MNYSVTAVTPKGLQWLSSANPAPLCVMLPPNMVSFGQQHAAGSSLLHFVLAFPVPCAMVSVVTVWCNAKHMRALTQKPVH